MLGSAEVSSLEKSPLLVLSISWEGKTLSAKDSQSWDAKNHINYSNKEKEEEINKITC